MGWASGVSVLVVALSCALVGFAEMPATVAAQEGDVVGAELRMELCLNGIWQAATGTDQAEIPPSGWAPRRVPEMPLTEQNRPAAMWYRRSLVIPTEWAPAGRRFFLSIEKAGHYAAVFCNGRRMGEHFGQFSPFEVELTGSILPGQANELAIYVHEASGAYVRPEAVVSDPMVGPSYRPGARTEQERNWVGIVGDVTLQWRPAVHVADVFVVTSVRGKSIEARLELSGDIAGRVLFCRGAVLDGGRVVLELPAVPVRGDKVTLSAQWEDPVLWGPAPYGEPKLYWLRVELMEDGRVIDRAFQRFGFREVWVSGRDVLLNGKKLWMVGTYSYWLSPNRYINDRRPMAAELHAMQLAGLNTLNGHWDDLGRPYLDLCDEMGVLVLAAFYCNSQLPYQPQADEGWADWMASTCAEWVRARRCHPSIVMWRPTCALPRNIGQFGGGARVVAALDGAVRAQDGTRPLANRTDVWDHNQGVRGQDGAVDDGTAMARVLAQVPKPMLTVEIWGDFRDVEGCSQFLRAFYEAAYKGGSTGFIPQHLPFFAGVQFQPQWLSLSGSGNRETDWRAARCANWCDASQPFFRPDAYAELMSELYRRFVGQEPYVFRGEVQPDVLAQGAPAETPVFMLPAAATAPATGVLSAPDGTAWFVLPGPGSYRLVSGALQRLIEVAPQSMPERPGYERVQRVSLSGP